MAVVVLQLHAELDLAFDALGDLARVRDALFSRHGERFRDLQRDIERLDEAQLTFSDPHDLGEGRFLFEPPKEIAALLARARDLGVT